MMNISVYLLCVKYLILLISDVVVIAGFFNIYI